ncbi:uncharacterized protein Dwil_GK20991 [Drosophila willistoni]|uniref:CBM39 domain-containing protein n=2 Tax=Drosophila willistoni TaxID=7260 RepID=B4MKE9_DROWI|nr:uncharacterized protein Dwil_GK20991 [Drosophila willistoni]
MHIRLPLVFTLLLVVMSWAYEVPNARVQKLSPNGFEVSIPDDSGISLFAFHGKLNEKMNGLEAGTWSQDITRSEGGRWTFRNTNTPLKGGDTLYFWTYVLKDGIGYRQDNGVYVFP